MIYYIGFYLYEVLMLGAFNKTRNKVYGFLGLIGAIVFSGLRYQTGYDYDSYEYIFSNIEDFQGAIEPGFFWFITFLKNFDIDNRVIFFLFSGFTQLFIYIGLRKLTKNYNLAFFIYLLIPGLYLNSFSIIRGALASSFFIYAAGILISENSVKKFIIIGIVSSLIHYTAVIPFFIFYIIKYKVRKLSGNNFLLIGMLLASIFISQSEIPNKILGILAGTRFEAYIEMYEPQGFFKVLAVNLLGLFILINSNSVKYTYPYSKYFTMWFIGIITYNIFVNFTAVTRVTYFFSFFSIPILLFIIDKQKLLIRNIYLIIVLLFFSSALINSLYNDTLNNNYPNMLDYKTVLFDF